MTIRKPVEISVKNVQSKLETINHQYSNNLEFVTKCADFLKFLYVKQTITDTTETNGYVQLMAEFFKEYLGGNNPNRASYYPNILSALEQTGLLVINHSYQKQTFAKKGNAKGYKLNLLSPLEAENDTLDKKYEKNWQIDDPQYLDKLNGTTIDKKKYVLLANLLHPPKKMQAMRVLDFWMHNCHYVKTDGNGRIHSLLSQMPKELRPALTVNQQPIYEVDLHACQPTLLLSLVYSELSRDTKLSFSEICNLYPEMQRYIDSIVRGEFYDVVFRKAKGKKRKAVDKYELSIFKKDLLARVFFSKIPKNDTGVIRHFKELYPTIYKVICDLKIQYGYKSLSEQLQRLESVVMTDALTMIRDNTNGWVLRFHDAILCTQSDVDLVHDSLLFIIAQKVGFEPKIKKDLWGGKDFKKQLDSIDFAFREVGLEADYGAGRVVAIKRASRRIYTTDETKAEQNNKYYKYINYLNSQEVADEVEKAQKAYIETKLMYPLEWNDQQIQDFKKDGFKIVSEQLEHRANTGSDFDKEVLKPALQYWGEFFN